MTDIFCTIYKGIDKNLGISMISKRNIASKSRLKLCKENNYERSSIKNGLALQMPEPRPFFDTIKL